MKKLAFIDPFVASPAVNCFNGIVKLLNFHTTYHMPAPYGVRSLEEHRHETHGYLIVGSASNVTEPLEWHGPLGEFLVEELKKGKPILGCCFGHQLICHALGSEVDYATVDQRLYSGVREITVTKDHQGLKQGEVFTLPVTHRQVVKKLGKGLVEIGTGLPNDIVSHESLPLLLTQAHPEASGYFCSSEIKDLPAADAARGRRDGSEFISRFFKRTLA